MKFNNMLCVAPRAAYLVLFWSLDRFSREGVLETLQHLQGLSSHGVEWFSYREEYLRSIESSRRPSLPSSPASPSRSASASLSASRPV
jgi:hypothetical protein